MSHLVRLLAKILNFAVFTTLDYYSCEKRALVCDGRLHSLDRSGTLFNSHINMYYSNIQFTVKCCELNGNLKVPKTQFTQLHRQREWPIVFIYNVDSNSNFNITL